MIEKIKSYDQFLNESIMGILDTKEKIAFWLDSMKIKKYTINDDLIVNVHGNVNLRGKKFKIFPVKFGEINGYFYCHECKNLTSLIGCPTIIDSNFDCSDCVNIQSFDGFPKEVSGNIYCFNTIFYPFVEDLGEDSSLEIFNGPKPASKENQEILIEVIIERKIDWMIISPLLDKQTIEKYKTTFSLNNLGF